MAPRGSRVAYSGNNALFLCQRAISDGPSPLVEWLSNESPSSMEKTYQLRKPERMKTNHKSHSMSSKAASNLGGTPSKRAAHQPTSSDTARQHRQPETPLRFDIQEVALYGYPYWR
jgi:hypothetical protein